MGVVATITEQSGNDLSDYQVRIEITDSAFFEECTDRKFIECYFQDGSWIPHYTEEFDPSANKAVIWVKVPQIPANGAVKVLIKVNPTRTEDLSDGEAVFDFFDDFEGDGLDTGKWTVDYTGSVTYELVSGNLRITDAAKSDGTYWIYNNTDTGSQIKANFTLLDRMIIEWKQKMETQSSIEQMGEVGIGLCKSDKTVEVYLAMFDSIASVVEYKMGYDIINGQAKTQTVTINADTYYVMRIVRDGENYKLEAVDMQGNVVYSAVTGSSVAAIEYMAICVGAYGGEPFSVMQIDWIRVRKYVEPEPSVSVQYVQETVTYSDYFYWGMAKMLSGAIANFMQLPISMEIYANDTLLKTLSLKEISTLTDTERQLIISVLKFEDDSSDSYTTNKQIVYVTDPDGNTKKLAESTYVFIKIAELPLLLGFEIHTPYEDSQMML